MTRFYVTLTWHDWPEGGSYGTIVEAPNSLAAENLAREEMRASYAEESDYDDDDDNYLDDLSRDWHVVDCFNLDDFIERHKE